MKYTIRLHDRDDKDLIEFLQGKNVSRAMREAPRAQIGRDAELEGIVRQIVSQMLFDFLSGVGVVSAGGKLTPWGCGRFLGLHDTHLRLRLYSIGLLPPSDILIRSSLYQRR